MGCLTVLVRCWVFSLGLLALAPALATEPVPLSERPSGSLGEFTEVLVESGPRLDLAAVLAARDQGRFRAGLAAVPNFGLGSKPVWLKLTVVNQSAHIAPYRLIVGTTWVDDLALMVVQRGQLLSTVQSGDGMSQAPYLEAGLGFAFPLRLPPGESELFIRAETPDPMVLPLQLLPEAKLTAARDRIRYGYGFLYGFLAALIAFNLMLFAGLRQRSHLYYSFYVVCFIAMNMAYTGHGVALLWPAAPAFQRFVNLVTMVIYSCSGLLFASGFLALPKLMPKLTGWLRGLALAGLIAIVGTVLFDWQAAASWVAFPFLTFVTLLMVLLGINAVRSQHVAGGYFLAAVSAGALGAASTSLSVWGGIPYRPLSFHAVELGILIEAVLLALALAVQVRRVQQERYQAEFQARIDPLTQVHNRRAFYELARPTWGVSKRTERPLSVVMMDLDHFKAINDRYGHAGGDQVLIEVAKVLIHACREGDVLARWGGEEFILLLPETDHAQAEAFAERVRQLLQQLRVPVAAEAVTITASFGVAEFVQDAQLDDLIRLADQQLFRAKAQGRNQVCVTPARPGAHAR